MKEKLLETFEKPIRFKKYVMVVNRRYAYYLIKNNIINEFKKYLIKYDNYWIVGFNSYDGKLVAIWNLRKEKRFFAIKSKEDCHKLINIRKDRIEL